VCVCGLFLHNVKLLCGLYSRKIICDNVSQSDESAKRWFIKLVIKFKIQLSDSIAIRTLYVRYVTLIFQQIDTVLRAMFDEHDVSRS